MPAVFLQNLSLKTSVLYEGKPVTLLYPAGPRMTERRKPFKSVLFEATKTGIKTVKQTA